MTIALLIGARLMHYLIFQAVAGRIRGSIFHFSESIFLVDRFTRNLCDLIVILELCIHLFHP